MCPQHKALQIPAVQELCCGSLLTLPWWSARLLCCQLARCRGCPCSRHSSTQCLGRWPQRRWCCPLLVQRGVSAAPGRRPWSVWLLGGWAGAPAGPWPGLPLTRSPSGSTQTRRWVLQLIDSKLHTCTILICTEGESRREVGVPRLLAARQCLYCLCPGALAACCPSRIMVDSAVETILHCDRMRDGF